MIPFPDKKYNIIYSDPAWPYSSGNTKHKNKFRGAAVHHYNTMSLDEIKSLPVYNLTEENAVLFMWSTFPNLQEGLDVIKEWGFTYKTVGFNWVKTNKISGTPFFGLGSYTRSNSEVCLIGVKGKLPRVSKKVSSVIISPIEEHSKKPDIVRDKIVELYGELPRIELFARQAAPGWDVWGDQVPNGHVSI